MALLGSLAWAMLVYFDIGGVAVLGVPLFIGLFLAKAVHAGSGKVTHTTQTLIALLMFASLLMGAGAAEICNLVWKEGVPLGAAWRQTLSGDIFENEWFTVSMGVALFTLPISLWYFGRKPKFKAIFEKLMPG